MNSGKRKKPAASRQRVETGLDYNIVQSREEIVLASGSTKVQHTSPVKGRSRLPELASFWPAHTLPETTGPENTNGDWEDISTGVEDASGGRNSNTGKKKRKRKNWRVKRPNKYWKVLFRDAFVDELLRGKGRGDYLNAEVCSECNGVDPSGVAREDRKAKFRCRDCFGGDMICTRCCVKRHRRLPFHVIEEWTGEFFEKTELKQLGLKIQLNHSGSACPTEKPCHSKFLVLHTNGIHRVNLFFCRCVHKRRDQYVQLLRRGLYPATCIDGRITTVATFAFLESLHLNSFTTKGSTYDFYRGLEKLTDNTRLNLPKSRYRPLLRMIRQWRHLKMLIWSGCGHEPGGIPEGKNLPQGWEQDPRQLKEQQVSSHSRDPPLNSGMGYFVAREPYEEYCGMNDSGDEISTCVPLAALAKQNTKFSRGLRYTGVGGVVCGRSDMLVRLGNLHRGERYRAMDWIFGKALRDFLGLLQLLVIYDIACQWFIHLLERVANDWPSSLRFNLLTTPGIGKLHEPGHRQEDHEQFSLNFIPGAGKTDGESCERVWGEHNNLGNATKTMGPGSREDNIDSKAGGWNWEKYVAMGATLCRRYAEAVKDNDRLGSEHTGLTSNLPESLVQEWEAMCVSWESAPFPKADIPNPYRIHQEFLSEEKALKELETDEKLRRSQGEPQYHSVTASGFLKMGLDLRDAQDKVLELLAEKDPTPRQMRKIEEESNTLRKHLATYSQLAPIYMPGLTQFLDDTNQREDTYDVEPEVTKIWLPSDVNEVNGSSICVPHLANAEAKLEIARCFDSLDGVRHTLRVKSRMTLFKNTNVRGQRESGKAREVINRVVDRVHRYANRYRAARSALVRLIGQGEWESTLRCLKDEDLRAMKDPALVKIGSGRKGNDEEDLEEEEAEFCKLLASKPKRWGDGSTVSKNDTASLRQGAQLAEVVVRPTVHMPDDLIHPDRLAEEHRLVHGTGETRKSHSWIWWAGGTIDLADGADENANEILRSEWCKSRARKLRAREEVLLLREEMRRTLEYLAWRAREWVQSADIDDGTQSRALTEGKKAYALAQASMQRRLQASFGHKFAKVTSGIIGIGGEQANATRSKDSIAEDIRVDGEDEDGAEDVEDEDEDEEDDLMDWFDLEESEDEEDEDMGKEGHL
ncbi:hypothetical protein VNI00_015204 [Paramarasmius palmivorus]|uniref:CxC2-like cysteine cluster KDZ transposase-associated domain-containing protein n=1 Tax=Paramarasmius palmivorus TaxID=297713 RepID=A0AAW0BLX0_9AGAR